MHFIGQVSKQMPSKTQRNQIDFPYAIRSFVGYLEGTKKSALTIKNYRLDISAFQTFIHNEYEGKVPHLDQISRQDLDRYRDHLKEKGFKTNTRRRKILTVTQFLNYLAKRKKVAPEMGKKIPAPHKIERVPFTVSTQQLISSIQQLPEESLIETRNKALLWTLAETGCLVSEVIQLKFGNWLQNGPLGASVQIGTKNLRIVPVSIDLFEVIQELKASSKDSNWIFLGFNKFGSLGSPITARGVEMLVKAYGVRLGFRKLTPRTFRHSVILKWFEDALPQSEIQARLGLKTTYAFRSYEPLIKSSSKTTSNSEMNQPES
jgi:integrase/recombinase XerD